jgi:uncharacterized protein YjiS (DUF1127 family)
MGISKNIRFTNRYRWQYLSPNHMNSARDITTMNATHTARPILSVPTLRPAALINRVSYWAALARQRRALAALDARLLADVGLTATAAKAEANRSFWDVPAHWSI